MFTVRSRDCTLVARLDGPDNGPVVMFANSLGSDLRVWDLLLPELPTGLRFLRYDKRGHGLSDCPDGPYTIEELVADAAAVADAADVQAVTFVGLSIGGLIGQGLSHSRPDIVHRLVLMDTAAKIGSDQMWQDRIANVAAQGLPNIADAILDRWFAPAFRQDELRLAPWRNMLSRTPKAGYIGCCRAIMAADFTNSASNLAQPVMTMVGADDQSTPPDVVKETAALYGAPCHVLSDAGHLPCVEKPKEVAALIAQFMETT